MRRFLPFFFSSACAAPQPSVPPHQTPVTPVVLGPAVSGWGEVDVDPAAAWKPDAPFAEVETPAPRATVPIRNLEFVPGLLHPWFRACYQRVLNTNAGAHGNVTIDATVGPKGDVTKVAIGKDPSAFYGLQIEDTTSFWNCVLRPVLQRAKFEPPEGGATSTVTILVRFTPRR